MWSSRTSPLRSLQHCRPWSRGIHSVNTCLPLPFLSTAVVQAFVVSHLDYRVSTTIDNIVDLPRAGTRLTTHPGLLPLTFTGGGS